MNKMLIFGQFEPPKVDSFAFQNKDHGSQIRKTLWGESAC